MAGTALPTTPSRRAVFAGAGALLAGAAIATSGRPDAPGADAELIAVCNRYIAAELELERKYGLADIEQEEPLLDEINDLIDRMAVLRAITLNGHVARVRAIKVLSPSLFQLDDGNAEEENLVAAVLRDLLPEQQT